MTRDAIVSILKRLEPQLRASGVAALYLFGSYGRDEAGADSDIDVLVDFVPGPRRGLRAFMAPQVLLESAFPGVEIGCSTRNGLHPLYRPHIEPVLVQVF